MNFREAITAVPFRPAQTQATGLLAPIIRASGHLLYITAAIAAVEENPEAYHLTNDEVQRELLAADEHLTRTVAVAEQAPVSTACKQAVIAFCDAVHAAYLEYAVDWPEDERGQNLKDLADRAAGLGSFFDGELAGIRSSDPGRTL